jgi:hypothetical protein
MKKDSGYQSNVWVLLLVFGAILVSATSVAAETYTAGDSNSNGQYQITLIVNPDGSETLSYAGVVGGTIIDNPPNEIYQPAESVGVGSESIIEPVLSQDLDMSGSYGYALLTGKNADGTGAAVETGFTNSDEVLVYQEIGNTNHCIPGPTNAEVSSPLIASGIVAYQSIFAPTFDTIYANAYASNADGSTATVSASAQGGNTVSDFTPHKQSGVDSDNKVVPSLFQVDQFSCIYGRTTQAGQNVEIKGVDSANVSAFASTSNGYSSEISAWVINGSLTTGRGGSHEGIDGRSSGQMTATVSKIFNTITTDASGQIETQSQQGGETSSVTGPNGDSAVVSSQWVWKKPSYGCYSEVSSTLEATTIQNSLLLHLNSISADMSLELPRSKKVGDYSGSITADTSLTNFKTKNFGNSKDASGSAGIIRSASGYLIYPYRIVN